MLFKAFMSTVSRLLNQLLESPYSFMAPVCLICGRSAQRANLCTFCLKQLPIVPEHCIQCARSLIAKSNFTHCGSCLTTSPPFHRTFVLFPYVAPIIEMLSRLKFQQDLTYAKLFGELFTEKLLIWYDKQPLPDLIVPIPLHAKRLRHRGFNQTLEIARPIAKKLHIPISFHVKRTKNTETQHFLDARARKANVANAFIADDVYEQKHVAILDDVVTTGCTITACAQVLKKRGARQIDIWCCARRM